MSVLKTVGGFAQNILSGFPGMSVPRNLYVMNELFNKGSSSKKTTKTNENTFIPADYDYDRIYNDLGKTSSGTSGGGVYKPNISSLLSAYDQQNEASNALAKAKYDSDRQALLTNIDRIQQQNALDTLRQTQSHANNLSSLESAGTEAARNARIQTAMRGLSGSGISQLNQLRNMINQGNKATAIAQSNTNSLEKLRQNLASASTDTNEKLAKILDTYTNAVSKANQNTAKQKASALWDVESAYANNLARAAASGGSSDSDTREAANDIYTNLRNTTTTLQNNLKAIRKMSTKELKNYVVMNGLGDTISTLAGLDGKNTSDLSLTNYRKYVEQALGQQSYNTINELNNTYGINPYNYTTAMNNISGLLYGNSNSKPVSNRYNELERIAPNIYDVLYTQGHLN